MSRLIISLVVALILTEWPRDPYVANIAGVIYFVEFFGIALIVWLLMWLVDESEIWDDDQRASRE